MASQNRNITVIIDPRYGSHTDFSPLEFFASRKLADADGLTVPAWIRARMTEHVARQRGIIVDFPWPMKLWPR
jgi:hypothetical protein